MAKLSPLQRVVREHKSKAELAKKVIAFLQAPEGESQTHFEERISHLSNTKLLRLWDTHQTMTEKYGNRETLISRIVKAKFSGGNEDYQRKISTFSTAKLLDLARQLKV